MAGIDFFDDLALPGGLFLLTVAFGIWLSKTGRPYNSLLFNIHKLIALAGVVLGAVRIFGVDDMFSLLSLAFLPLALLAAGVIAQFASGALMSIREQESRLTLGIHQAGLILIALAGAVAFFLSSGVKL